MGSMLLGFYLGRQNEFRLHNTAESLFPAAMNSRHALILFSEQKKIYYDAVMTGEESLIKTAHEKFKDVYNELSTISKLSGIKKQKIEGTRKILNQLRDFTTSAETVYSSMCKGEIDLHDEINKTNPELQKKALYLNAQSKKLHSILASFADSFAKDLKMELSSISATTMHQRYLNLIVFLQWLLLP